MSFSGDSAEVNLECSSAYVQWVYL